MAKNYERFKRRAAKRRNHRATNFVARLERVEMMLFELNARLVREAKSSEKLEEWDTDFLEAAEEFRAFLGEVHSGR